MPALPEVLDLPGFVEIHAHLREPGNNQAESIASGTRAALIGGYAVIGDMPNTPGRPTWTEERMLEKHTIAESTAYIPTTFHAGSQPNSNNTGELEKMAKHSLWLKLYGAPTTGNDADYEAADFEETVAEWHRVAPDKPIGFHAGQHNLEDMIGLVAGKYQHPMHIHHVGSAREVKLAQAANDRGQTVTTGVCPHHLLKTAHDVISEGWYARVMPELLDQTDAEELMHLLADRKIDIIETDHAPHTIESKDKAEDENPLGIHDPEHTTCFGLPGIEFAAPLLFYQVKRNLAKRGNFDMDRLVTVMSTRPAQILGVKIGKNTRVHWDMREFRIGEDDVQSNSGWTPYMGKLAIGVVDTFDIGGQRLVSATNIVGQKSDVITERGTEI